MTSRTISGGALISICMALNAIHSGMGSCQCKISRIVVETIFFATRRVAGQACWVIVNISAGFIVFTVRFRVGMTDDATELSIIGRVGVAIETLVPFSLVPTTVYGEEITIVVFVLSRHPVRVNSVALNTIG